MLYNLLFIILLNNNEYKIFFLLGLQNESTSQLKDDERIAQEFSEKLDYLSKPKLNVFYF